MLQNALASRGCADDKRTIGNGLGQRFEFLCLLENLGRADGGARFAEGNRIGIHQTQPMGAEIAHGTGGGADIQRIARADKYDDEVFEFGRYGQAAILKGLTQEHGCGRKTAGMSFLANKLDHAGCQLIHRAHDLDTALGLELLQN